MVNKNSSWSKIIFNRSWFSLEKTEKLRKKTNRDIEVLNSRVLSKPNEFVYFLELKNISPAFQMYQSPTGVQEITKIKNTLPSSRTNSLYEFRSKIVWTVRFEKIVIFRFDGFSIFDSILDWEKLETPKERIWVRNLVKTLELI